jgi:hypothetical protein
LGAFAALPVQFGFSRSNRLYNYNDLLVNSTGTKKVFLNIYKALCLLTATLVIFAVLALKDTLQTKYYMSALFLIMAPAFILGARGFFFAAEDRIISHPRYFSTVYLVIIAVYMNGVLSGESQLSPSTDYIIKKPPGAICASVLFSGDRGLIYYFPDGSRHFLRWEAISEVVRVEKSCDKVTARPRARTDLHPASSNPRL